MLRIRLELERAICYSPPEHFSCQPRLLPRGGQVDRPGNFMKLVLEFDIFRFFDACSPGHGGLFSKTRN